VGRLSPDQLPRNMLPTPAEPPFRWPPAPVTAVMSVRVPFLHLHRNISRCNFGLQLHDGVQSLPQVADGFRS